MTATDDRPTLHELKTFAHECETEADRLETLDRLGVLLASRLERRRHDDR